MTHELRPYREYKDSGLPWLGEIPAHWELLRAKFVFRDVDERSLAGEETHLSMSQKHGLVESSKIDQWSLHSESYAGAKLCKANDLVLNRLKAHLGVFAHASLPGVVSPDYTVFRMLRQGEVRYFELLFKSPTYIAELRRSTKGIVEGFWRLYTDDFYNIRVAEPPAAEQQIILNWIDRIDQIIRRFIRNKRRLIELLNEQKQAIINRAVTRGLDPSVRLKASGIDWLGDVPEHWDIQKLKRLTRFQNGLAFKPSDWKGSGVPIIRIQNLNGSEHFNYTDRQDLPDKLLIRPGELLFSWSGNRGTSFGPFLWERRFGAYLNQHIFKLSHYSFDTKFFYYLLRAVTRHVEEQTHGIIGLVHITKPELGVVQVPVPPLNEQKSIAHHLDEACAEGILIRRARREIQLILEYRTRMISDVVTGKLDVRNLASKAIAGSSEDLAPLDNGEAIDDELQEVEDPKAVEEVADAD